MKRCILLLFFAAAFGLEAVNVRDFGAKGDGQTDDTAAIQKAVSFLAKQIKLDRFRLEDGWNGGSSETHVDELYFPAGTYKVSRTIVADGSAAWRGEKNTRIVMTDPNQDILYCRIYRRAMFDSIEFEGGKTQVHLWNNNWNASSVHISRCTFLDSSGVALRSLSRRVPKELTPNVKAVLMPPYEVEFKNDIPILKPNDYSKTAATYSSNIISVRDSGFLNCMQAFEFDNDGTMVENCRIVANPATEGPIIIVGIGQAPNMLAIWNLHAEAPATDKAQYWIKNEGFYLTCNDSVFRSARPMALLDQNTLRIPAIAGSVSINRCTFQAAGNPEGALIALRRVPSIFKFIDNRNDNGDLPLFKWYVTPDLRYLETDSFRGKHQDIPWSLPNKYNIIIAGNRDITTNLPEVLKPFCKQDIPELHQPPSRTAAVPEFFQGELKAIDFGVKPDGKTDNSAALTKALNAAAKARKTLLIPSGRIRLASTVTLPQTVSLRGEGMPIIFGDKRGGYDLFHAPELNDLRFRSLILRNGDRILAGTLTGQSRLVRLEDCLTYDTGALSIELTGPTNHCRLHLVGSLWNGAGGIVSECAFSEVAMCWLANNFWMDKQAFFTVRKGTLVMRSGFFVPYVTKNIKRKNSITGEEKVWPLGGNLRWVDNAGGKVYLYDCRGGGEAGGYSTLQQTAPGGTVYIEGGLARCTNRDTRNYIFYAEAAPESAAIVGVGGYPVHTLLGVYHKVWGKAPGVPDFPLHILGVMTPQEP